jgi:hypothetical protein
MEMKMHSHNPKNIFRTPDMMNKMLELRVENKTMYMPVLPATVGFTPKARRNGLKITPPPNPKVPLTNPPKRPTTIILKAFFQFHSGSLGAN